jgi:serine/threonine protein kinase/tetratricopeptide (TPR) repeat protein
MAKICCNCQASNRDIARYCVRCGHTAFSLFSLAPGTVLDNGAYIIKKGLGMGGFGAVYLAQDARLGHPWVVKHLLIPEHADAQEINDLQRTFRREAESLSSLNTPGNPHIPEIVTYFSDASGHYLVMKYIEGETLENRLKQSHGGVDWKEAVKWIIAVADALVYMHGRTPSPILHRDIKPANIMIDTQQRVWLVDFGLSKARPTKSSGTVSMTQPLGTVGYAPPEQYSAGATVPASDVYALAATLYHLGTGDDPTDHPMLFPLLKKLPNQLKPIVTKALEKKPDKRPTAVEFKRDLEQFLQPVSSPPGTPSLIPQSQRPLSGVSPLAAPPPRPALYTPPRPTPAPAPIRAKVSKPAYGAHLKHLYQHLTPWADWMALGSLSGAIILSLLAVLLLWLASLPTWLLIAVPALVGGVGLAAKAESDKHLSFGIGALVGAGIGYGIFVVTVRAAANWVGSPLPLAQWGALLGLLFGAAWYQFQRPARWKQQGRLAIVLTLIVVSSAIFIRVSQPSWYFYPIANNQFKARQFEQARRSYQAIYAQNPIYRDVYAQMLSSAYNAGQKCLAQAKWACAQEELAFLLQYEPEYADAADLYLTARAEPLYQEGVKRLEQEAWVEAETILAELLRIDPHYKDTETLFITARAEPLYREGLIHLSAQRWAEAATTLQVLANQYADYKDVQQKLIEAQAEPHYRAGLDYLRQEAWEAAEAAFAEVVRIDPDYKEVVERMTEARVERYYQAGQAYLEAERWSEAAAEFSEVVAIDPDYKDAADLLVTAQVEADYRAGVAFLEAGAWGDAVAAFDKTLAIVTDYKDVVDLRREALSHWKEGLYALGVQHSDAEEWSEAAAAFAQTRALDPAYLDVSERLAEPPLREAMLAFYEARWQAQDVALRHMLNGHEQAITAVVFNPINTLLATADASGQVILWEGASGQEQQRLPRQSAAISALTFVQECPSTTADCDLLLVFGDETGKVSAWDVEAAQIRYTLNRHNAQITAVAFEPEALLLATADQSGIVHVWQAMNGGYQYRIEIGTGAIWSLSYTSQNILAAATQDGGIRLFRNGQGLKSLTDHAQPVRQAQYGPAGDALVSADADGHIWLWQIPSDFLAAPANAQFTHEELTHLENTRLTNLNFFPLGNRLVLATGTGVTLWPIDRTRRTGWLLTDEPVQAAACSPYGWLLALGQDDGSIQIWAASTQP